jgi:hypothetical protein
MDKILGAIGLSLILRIFCGIFFLVGFATDKDDQIGNIKQQFITCFSSSSTLGASLFIGFVIYCTYRAILYPILEFLFNCSEIIELRREYGLISNNSINLMFARWARADKWNPELQFSKHLGSWADYTHFLYTSGIALIAGKTISTRSCYNTHILWLAVLLIVGGVISDWRLHRIQDIISTNSGAGNAENINAPERNCFFITLKALVGIVLYAAIPVSILTLAVIKAIELLCLRL